MKLSCYELAGHLADHEPAPVFVLSGDQELLRELAVQDLTLAVLGGEPTPFNCERFDGQEAEGERVVMAANMLPLLGGRRLVLVKRASKLVDKSEALSSYVSNPSPRTVLVLELEKKPDARRKSWKELEKRAVVVGCDAPTPAQLERWVTEQASARNLKLGRESVAYLISEFGSDLRRLASELEKLSLYAGKERLDLETIASVLGRGKAQSIFKFIDAVAAGDATSALRQLGRLMDEGEPALRILALLDRLVGQLRVAREARASARRGPPLASLLRMPPAAARRLVESARRFDERALGRAVGAVAETDRILKSSRLPDRVVLEALVISLCAPGARGREARRISSPRSG